MKPKIFLRKLLRGGNSIEDVFKMDSLSITDKGVDNTYVSKIDLTSDSFTFNEAYVNTYYLHLSIFCYYYVKQQNQNLDRPQFITDSVDKIKDYVKCFVLYKILKQIINSSVPDDDKQKYINAIKSTDAFDQFDDKTIQGVSSNLSNLNNMKILLNAIAIIIKYSGDDNNALIATLNSYCTNFDDLLSNEQKKTALNELLTKSQNAKATYEKSSKFLNKKMEIFEEIKREVKSKLDEYKSKFLATMKDKQEYKLISKAKIEKVKNLAVDVIEAIKAAKATDNNTPQQIANIVTATITKLGTTAKTEINKLFDEFNKLSQDEKQDQSMMVIQDLIDKKDDSSSLAFSTYYEKIASSIPSTGGRKRRMKKKKGGVGGDEVTLFSSFKATVDEVQDFLKRLSGYTTFSQIKKSDVKNMTTVSQALNDIHKKAHSEYDSLSKEELKALQFVDRMKILTDTLKSEYEIVKKAEEENKHKLGNTHFIFLVQTIQEMLKTSQEAQNISLAIQNDANVEEIPHQVESDQSKLQVVPTRSVIDDSQLKEMGDVINTDPENVTSLGTKDRAMYEAIIKLYESPDDSSVELPQELDRDKLIKMVKTIQMSVTIENDKDLLTADIVGIDDDLKSLAANIKSVSAIFKRLNDDDIKGIIGGTVDEAALNQLKESVSKKLNMELNEYDKENNDNLKKKLDNYEAILKSATDITQLAQKIIENHKTGGFRKLFYKKKRRGGDGEEGDPEELDMPRIEDLEKKYSEINKKIETEITKLGKDIEETKSFITRYNEGSEALKTLQDTGESSRINFTTRISAAEANKQEAIQVVTNDQNSKIADLMKEFESFNQTQDATKADLSKEKEQLIHNIKMKVTEIEKLKVLTGIMIEKAKKILGQKEMVINTIIKEKEQELKRIEKTIESKEKLIREKKAEDAAIAASMAAATEKRISDVRNEEAQKNKLEQMKEKLNTELENIIVTKERNKSDRSTFDNKIEEYERNLKNAKRDNILEGYDLRDIANEDLNQIKFDLFTTQEELEDPKTFLKETNVESLRGLATNLLELTLTKKELQTGGGESDDQFINIIGSDSYIKFNITIANKLYHAAKEAKIDIEFSDTIYFTQDNLTINLLCDYLILKLNKEYTSSPSPLPLPPIIKKLLREFRIDNTVTFNHDLNDLNDLDNIQEILNNITTYINDIYLIEDPKHFVFGISLLIKYINEVFNHLAFSYSNTDASLATPSNKIRNIDRANDYLDIKTKIKEDVENEYNERGQKLTNVKEEISKIQKILEGNQPTTVAPEVVSSSDASLSSAEAAPITGGDYKKRRIEWFNKVFMRILKLKSYSKYAELHNAFDQLNTATNKEFFNRNTTKIGHTPDDDYFKVNLFIMKFSETENDIRRFNTNREITDDTINIGTDVIVKFDSKKLIFYKDTNNTIRYVKYTNKNKHVFLDLLKMDAIFTLEGDDVSATNISINVSDYGNDSDDKRAYRKTMLDWFNKVKRYIERRKDNDYTEINNKFTPLGESSTTFDSTLSGLSSNGNLSKFNEDQRFYDALVVINKHTNNKAIKLKDKGDDKDGELNDSSVVKITVSGSGSGSGSKTLDFITNNNKITYVKFLPLGIYLKLTDISMDFDLKEGDENLTEISIDQSDDYDEKATYTSEDKLYKMYEKYKDVNNITSDTTLQTFLTDLGGITKKSTANNKVMNYTGTADPIIDNLIFYASDNNNPFKLKLREEVKPNSGKTIYGLRYRKTNFIGEKTTTNKIYLRYIKLGTGNIYISFDPVINYNETTPQLTGGAPNTEKPNNIFNAYIIMVMNKIMEMDDTNLKDFTTKAQIAPAQA